MYIMKDRQIIEEYVVCSLSFLFTIVLNGKCSFKLIIQFDRHSSTSDCVESYRIYHCSVSSKDPKTISFSLVVWFITVDDRITNPEDLFAIHDDVYSRTSGERRPLFRKCILGARWMQQVSYGLQYWLVGSPSSSLPVPLSFTYHLQSCSHDADLHSTISKASRALFPLRALFQLGISYSQQLYRDSRTCSFCQRVSSIASAMKLKRIFITMTASSLLFYLLFFTSLLSSLPFVYRPPILGFFSSAVDSRRNALFI